MNSTSIAGHELFSCVAWANTVSKEEARRGVPGSVLSVYPADDGAMVAYGPVETPDLVVDVLTEKLRGGTWEWRDEKDQLIDRGGSVPTVSILLAMPSVRAKVGRCDEIIAERAEVM